MIFRIAGIDLPTIQFLSVRMAMKQMAIYLAMKKDIKDETLATKTYFTGNFQYSLSKSVVIGYVYGLYEGANSISIQFYL
jgi:hypothetical protein